MSAEFDRSRPLYDRLVPVKVQLVGRESRIERVCVRIIHGTRVRARPAPSTSRLPSHSRLRSTLTSNLRLTGRSCGYR